MSFFFGLAAQARARDPSAVHSPGGQACLRERAGIHAGLTENRMKPASFFSTRFKKGPFVCLLEGFSV